MYLLFDIGGTKTRLAISCDLTKIDECVKFETPHLFDEAMSRIEEEAENLLQGRAVKAAAGGIRGPLNQKKDSIVSETVLTDWIGKPLGETLQNAFEAPVFIENDTAMVGLGEAHYGAGKGYPIVAYHTVSTGVGGARIVGGNIDIAHIGFEPGKQIIDFDHTVLRDFSRQGTLEELISGEALEKRAGKKAYEVDQGDAVWEELAEYLAAGLKNTILYWSPDVIVLGGSMIVGDPRIPLQPIRFKLNALVGGLVPCPPLFDATLKDEGGLYGALALLSQKKKYEKIS